MKINRYKSVVLCLIILSMMVLIAPMTVSGATGTMPESGTGSSSDPYIIDEASELVWMGENYDTATPSYNVKNAYFRQTTDIDMSSISNFTPIGNGSTGDIGTAFSGQYDGQKFKIINLTINSNLACAALFQNLNGTVKNVILENANIVSTSSTYSYGNAAGIAGYFGFGTISGCGVSGTISLSGSSAYSFTAGIAGTCYGTITDCWSTAALSNTNTGGTIGGIGAYTGNSSCTISKNYFAGTQSGASIIKGGIVGNYYTGTISGNLYLDTSAAYGLYSTSNNTGCARTTDADMKKKSTFESNSWLFTTIWKINEGLGYPQFITTPGTPANLVLEPGNAAMTVRWDATAGASGYHVYFGNAAGVYGTPVDAAGTSATITALTNGTKYYVCVKALHMAEEGAASAELYAIPHIPVNDLTAAASSGRIDLTFSAPAGADTVELQQSTNGGTSYSPASGVSLTAASTSAAMTSLVNGTEYTYRLRLVYGGMEYFSNAVTIRAGNAVNTLAAFTVTGCTLNQTFSPSTYSYTSNVSGGAVSAGVTATVQNPLSSLKINGIAQASGVEKTITLSYGNTVIVAAVTAENGITQNYTLTITKPMPASAVTKDAIASTDTWGDSDILYVGCWEGSQEDAAIQFDLTGAVASPKSIYLKIYIDASNSMGTEAAFKLYGSDDDSWTTSMPASKDSTPIYSNITGLPDGWATFDVTNYVNSHITSSHKTITFYLEGILKTGNNDYAFHSSTYTNKPNLTLLYTSSDGRLSSISVNGTNLSGFSPDTYTYDYAAPHGADASTYTFTSVLNNSADSQGVWTYDSLTKSWSVLVTAEDGTTTHTYTVHVNAALKSSDATLSSISFNGSPLAGFASSTIDYSYEVAHGTDASAFSVSSVVNDHMGSQAGWAYNAGTMKWSNLVTAEDGTTKTYTITIDELPSTDAALSSISIGGTALTGFVSSTLNYTYDVVHGTDASGLLLTSVKHDHNAVPGSWTYDAGTHKWSLMVTAEDGTTTKTYTVTVIELPSTDATLSSISIDGTDLTGFSSSTLAYTYDVAHGTDASSLLLDSVKHDHNAALGTWTYDAGTHTWSITVTAEDGTTEKTYTVTINELPSTDAALSSISVDGTDLAGFSASTLDYTYDVVHGTDAADLLLASVKHDHNAVPGIWTYDAGSYKWSITVTAEDGTTEITYTVTIHELPSTDSTLSSISVNGTAVSGFSSSTFEYTFDVVHGTFIEPQSYVSVTNDENAIQQGWMFDPFTGRWMNAVTAENGVNYSVYFVTINELPSTDATLSSISIGGTDISGFSSATFEYTYDVVHGTDASTLLLDSVKHDHNAVPGSWMYDAGTHKWSIEVTAEDGTTTKTYTVTVNELPSTDAALSSISVDGTDLAGFSASTLDYTFDVAHGTDAAALLLDSVKNDPTADAGSWTYDAGTRIWSITVTAEDGTTEKTYTVSINELPSTDAALSSISIDGTDLAGFVSSTYNYTYDVVHGTDASGLLLAAVKHDHNADPGSWTYDAGTYKWSISVTAEDGTTEKTYTVTVNELPSTDAALSSISIDGTDLAGFVSSTLNYTYDVDHGTDAAALLLTSVKHDHNADPGSWAYDAVTHIWSLTVTAEDGTTELTYTVTIHELPSTDAALSSISIDGTAVSGFSSSTLDYTFDVVHGTDIGALLLTSVRHDHNAVPGTWTYDAGTYTWSITITAEDGTTEITYTVTIHELPSTDATLSSISVDGTAVTGFVSSTLDYTFDVVHGTDASGVLLASVKHDHNADSGTWTYDAGTYKWSLTVTAEDGTTELTYTVTIHELASTDATLSSISIDGTDLAGFSSSNLDYTYDVVHGTDASGLLPDSVKHDHNAVPGTWAYDAVTHKWSITVTAEDGTTELIYTVTVNELPSTDAALSSISVDGTDVSGFSSSTLDYTFDVVHGTDASGLLLTSVSQDYNAVPGSWTYDAGTYTWSITVTAEDGTTEITYTVTIHELPSTDAALSSISINGADISEFSSSTLNYTYDVVHGTDAADLLLASVKHDHNAVSGSWTYDDGTHNWSITLTAEDGTTELTYMVTIHELPSTDATLKTIKVNGAEIPGFTPLKLDYTINEAYDFDIASLGLTTQKNDTSAVLGVWRYSPETGKWSITVTAEDGVTLKTYTITVHKADPPIVVPTIVPTVVPTVVPTTVPVTVPTNVPTTKPGAAPTGVPTVIPTISPTDEPSQTTAPGVTDAPTQTPAVPTDVTPEPTGTVTLTPKSGFMFSSMSTWIWVVLGIFVLGSASALALFFLKKKKHK